jgi:hypothetical protein
MRKLHYIFIREKRAMNEYHKNHKLLWNEAHRTGEAGKSRIINRLELPYALSECYACQSVKVGKASRCSRCPIFWVGEIRGGCTSPKSPYYKWENAKTPRTRKKYAKIIANMKWRTKK